mmetsp:Transcript_127/g.148  ORF Transcript_127/g.148 Transcript_127/m.148 type:complete len:274 (-) Transcript_127:1000-1821(-)
MGTQASLCLADYVVTEAGFGADLGAEKFFDIKCRKTGLVPSCAVIVATVRALKLHGGHDEKALTEPDAAAVKAGMPNLLRHIENVKKFGVPAVVAINKFYTDMEEELDVVKSICEENGVKAILSEQWEKGGTGAKPLAEEVIKLCEEPSDFKFLYPDELSLDKKIETVATEIYRAGSVQIQPSAKTKLKKFERMGYGHLPICIAKTQYSFSNNPKALNAPEGHTITVQDVRLSAGAEFVVVLTGDIMTMPGLPKTPAANNITLDDNGEIFGLF